LGFPKACTERLKIPIAFRFKINPPQVKKQHLGMCPLIWHRVASIDRSLRWPTAIIEPGLSRPGFAHKKSLLDSPIGIAAIDPQAQYSIRGVFGQNQMPSTIKTGY
jgi:hypothetical protein